MVHPGARHERIDDVRVERILRVQNGGDSALGVPRVRLRPSTLCDHHDIPVLRGFQRERQARNPTAYDEKIAR
jgi:hypothetical protein